MSVLLPNQLWSPWHTGKTGRGEGQGHRATSEAPISRCFVCVLGLAFPAVGSRKVAHTSQVHSTGR